MQLQFQKKPLPCLQRIKGEVQVQEQTQELRLTEDMPDIGSVLGAWGQVLVRGKEWRTGEMDLSCGIMAWVMYQPEDESGHRMVEAWIPFQLKWELPHTEHDGRIYASCLLRSIDARVISARKLMLRASVSALAEAWISDEVEFTSVDTVPEDICLLKKTYPVLLPRETGEKAFLLEEELTLPQSAPKIDMLLRYSLRPELVDKKVLSDKVVLRGVGHLHILYKAEDGSLHTWDFELPFSQYSDLDESYGPEAQSRICVAVTSLELDADNEGRMHLRAGLTGQYVISDPTELELVEDAYSISRSVTVHKEEVQLPVILEEQLQKVCAEQTVSLDCSRVVDMAFYPDQPHMEHNGEIARAELGGQFQVLYYNQEGLLQGTASKWKDDWSVPADVSSQIQAAVLPSGEVQSTLGAEVTFKSDILLDVQTMASQGMMVVTGLEAGEAAAPDPGRPSLILRRAGKDTLWEIAKMAGSTEEAIRKANHLQGDPQEEQMLLIPVL